MRILSSPKPPSPSLYFRTKKGDGCISKVSLEKGKHVPQGRKFYLHKFASQGSPWSSRQPGNEEQKSTITPLRDGMVFFFHVDFDNLSERELALLCFALRPSEAFRHKLGMGKPIGLGTVRVDPLGIFYVDRVRRYDIASPDSNGCRYHGGWCAGQDALAQLPSRFSAEKTWVEKNSTYKEAEVLRELSPSFHKLRDDFAKELKNTDIGQALELIGNPDSVTAPVHYPLLAGQNEEKEGFRWFMDNEEIPITDLKRRQQLAPISTPLPTLRRTRAHP